MVKSKTAGRSLWVVMDEDGKQRLCTSRPILQSILGSKEWIVNGAGSRSEGRMIPLNYNDGLDASCFEGKNRWKAYRVGIQLL